MHLMLRVALPGKLSCAKAGNAVVSGRLMVERAGTGTEHAPAGRDLAQHII